MSRRVYVIALTIDAHLEGQLPDAMDVTTELTETLPRDWYSEDHGHSWWLAGATTVGDVYLEDLDPS